MNITKTKLSYISHAQKIYDEASLCVVESETHLPFSIKRVYYISSVERDAVRGKHAHKHTLQMLYCIQGHVRILLDNGTRQERILMTNAHDGLFLDAMMWHEMYDFSPDAVLLILASDTYNEDDYIRSYDSFKQLAISQPPV